jgi:hypothetical protein
MELLASTAASHQHQQQQPARSTPGSGSVGLAGRKVLQRCLLGSRYVARGTINAYRGWAAKHTIKVLAARHFALSLPVP